MITAKAADIYTALKELKDIFRAGNGSLPVLEFVLLEIRGKKGVLRATNLDEYRVSEFPLIFGGDEDWATCVPMKTVVFEKKGRKVVSRRTYYPFLDLMSVLAKYKEVVRMEFDEGCQLVSITVGRSKSTFKCLDAVEFPPEPQPKEAMP